VLDHLGPLRKLLPPAAPRPPDPAMSLAHPAQHLPPAPAPTAQAPAPKTAARHAPPHHAPPPARAAQSCAPPQRTAAPVPAQAPAPPKHTVQGFFKRLAGADGHHGSAYSFLTGITGVPGKGGHMGALGAAQTFFNGIGNSLGDGLVGAYDHATGDTDHELAVLDDAKAQDEKTRRMLLGLGGGEHGLAATLGQAAADKLFAQQYPAAASELDRDAAGQWAQAKAGVADQAYNDPLGDLALVVPGGRAAVVSRLEKAAAGARAAGDLGQAARLERAVSALNGGRAGAAVRDAQAAAARKLSAGGKASLAKGRAAVGKYQERKAAGVRDPHDPLVPHTPGSLAKGQAAAAGMRDRWHDGAQGKGAGQGQPAVAHAGGGGGGKTSRPIGRPSLVQRMIGKSKVGERPTLSKRIKDNKQSPADVAPVVSTPVTYGEFDLSKKAIEFRRTYKNPKTGKVGYWGTSNIAVFEYMNPQGELETLAVKSKPFVEHSEPIGLLELEKRGISFDKVERVYTERQPCSTNSKNCDTLLASELPGKPVFHSFEYGADEASQQAGNRALAKALRKWQKETKQ